MLSLNLISYRYPLSNFVRVITRQVNFQSRNPREPHFDRKKMIEVCKPIFLPKNIPDWETCSKSIAVHEEPPHPYEVLLANELTKNWESSRMILFYHIAPLSNFDHKQIRNAFFKSDLFFHKYSESVVKLALKDTPFKSVLHLFQCETALLFGADIIIDKVLKISRKHSQVVLMAGIIDNVLYSRNQLQSINDLLKRDGHQELTQLLDYLPSKLSGTINHHTRLLCHYLSQVSNKEA